jgi:hypothetical protein
MSEKFWICFEVRDSKNRLIKDTTGEIQNRLSLDLEVKNDTQLKSFLKSYYITLEAWMPENQIKVKAFAHDEISRTYMELFCFDSMGLHTY